jgi:hypothetical protein
MSYITARPKQVEIRSHWFRLLLYLFGLVAVGLLCWLSATGRFGEFRGGEYGYWVFWLGFLFCAALSVIVIWNLFHAGEVMIRVSEDGVWIKGRNGGTAIPWGLVDNIYRPGGKQKQFLVLEITDENYRSLNRGAVHTAIFHLNKLLGLKGIPLNIAGATVSHEQFESWVAGYWNDWKEQQAELGLMGKP